MIDETYIKMCDCVEIQEGHEWATGDCYLGKDSGSVEVFCKACADEWCWDIARVMRYAIWLPLNHQLQEMYGACNHIAYLCGLNDFAFGKRHGENMGHDAFVYPANFHSTKELALAMLMQHKHNKTWDGETWTGGNDGKE